MEKKTSFGGIIKLSGAFAACAIGSGFATGQEILQFFTAYGPVSLVGTVVSALIFAWCAACFMKHGNEFKLSSPSEVLKFYLGERLWKIGAVLIQVFLFSVYVIMVAGAGATLAEFFGAPEFLGRVLIALFTLITVVFGLLKAVDILGGMGTVIIAFALGIGIIAFLRNPSGVKEAAAVIPILDLQRARGGWLWSSILYPGYNAIVVIFLSCCAGATAANKKEAVYGGALGGVLLGAAISAMNLGLMSNIREVGEASVPTLILARDIHPAIAAIFSIVIFLGIYTTAVPMLWGVVRQFAEDGTEKSSVLTVILTIIGLLLGMTDFRKLVNIIYPFSGYAGVVFLILVMIKDTSLRVKKHS